MKMKLSGYYVLPGSSDPVSFDFEEVFDSKFMKRYTRYKSFDQFLAHSRFNITGQEDFEKLPEDKMDKYVSKNTKFASWQEMIDFATDRHIKKNAAQPSADKV